MARDPSSQSSEIVYLRLVVGALPNKPGLRAKFAVACINTVKTSTTHNNRKWNSCVQAKETGLYAWGVSQ